MNEMDAAVEGIMGPILEELDRMGMFSRLGVHLNTRLDVQAMIGVLRRAVEDGRRLGQRESLEGPCSRAEAFAKGKAEGRREAFEEAASEAHRQAVRGDMGFDYGAGWRAGCSSTEKILRALAKEGR